MLDPNIQFFQIIFWWICIWFSILVNVSKLLNRFSEIQTYTKRTLIAIDYCRSSGAQRLLFRRALQKIKKKPHIICILYVQKMYLNLWCNFIVLYWVFSSTCWKNSAQTETRHHLLLWCNMIYLEEFWCRHRPNDQGGLKLDQILAVRPAGGILSLFQAKKCFFYHLLKPRQCLQVWTALYACY